MRGRLTPPFGCWTALSQKPGTAVDINKIADLDEKGIAALSADDFADIMAALAEAQAEDRKNNQILYYKPASPSAAKVHVSTARVVGIFGGNGASKTDTALAEACALATGVLPAGPPELRAALRRKFRGPIRVRVVIESLTTTIEVILSKLKWFKWSGVGEQGSSKGHWGWIPKDCLKDGDWEKSWKDKLRTLTIICRDPDDHERILGESMLQLMSHDQDPSDFASGDFHLVINDEPPRLAIWRENEARTMRVAGRQMLAMTWPDDPSIPVDWIHDEVYEKGVEGPGKAKDVDCFELWSTDNVNLDQASIAVQMASWSQETRNVRIFGKPIRFSNRIHPLFTDAPLVWSYAAGKVVTPDVEGVCPETGSSDIVEFCHVADAEASISWPCVFLLDPHPRKPHMGLWAQIDPNDDVQVVHEFEMDADPADLRDYVYGVETSYGLRVAERLIDPNMGRTPASAIRGVTWQDEFQNVGLNCSLADDSDVGRARINEYLRPDNRTLRPRLVFSSRCQKAIHQMKRYVWDNYRRQDEKDLKQTPRRKNDDFPTLLKYLLNMNPQFALLNYGAPVIHRGRGMADRAKVRV